VKSETGSCDPEAWIIGPESRRDGTLRRERQRRKGLGVRASLSRAIHSPAGLRRNVTCQDDHKRQK
jgi:hypothetical protein